MNIPLTALLLTLMLVSGCIEYTPAIEGRYYSEINQEDYLELRSDGSYIVSQEDAFAGRYTTDSNQIVLTYTFGSFELSRKGNFLIDADGDRWIKQ